MTTALTTAVDAKAHLELLHRELELARGAGLVHDVAYMADLREEIAVFEAAWIGAAVTEIAVLRGELSGRGQG